ncbi:MAG: hypothetical protein E7254_10195 [Lachnospiraceae bacterium]|nr:hypothetical protein [Lachnospiraceae bacterium]
MRSKKIISSLLCLTMAANIGGVISTSSVKVSAKELSGAEYKKQVSKELDDILPDVDKKEINSMIDTSVNDGKKVAKIINQIEDEDDFNYAVNKVLTDYYEEDEKKKIDDFSKTIENDADDIVSGYENAYEERNSQDELDYEVGTIVINFKKDTGKDNIKRIISAEYGKAIDLYETSDGTYFAYVKISLGHKVDDAVDAFNKYDCVISAEKNTENQMAYSSIVEAKELINDQKSNKQWYLNAMLVPNAWGIVNRVSHKKVKVAVLDTGVSFHNTDLNINKELSYDVTNDKKLYGQETTYTSNHGTMVSGVIGAISNNETGIAGVASGTYNNIIDLINIKISKIKDGKEVLYDADLIKGIDYAISIGVKVINISSCSGTPNSAYRAACERAYNASITVVCSAGNDGSSAARYPAAYPTTLAIASMDENFRRSSFTSYGTWTDFSAPGGDIYTTGTTGFVTTEGTSFSAPCVAAIVAMMYSVNSKMNADYSETYLEETVFDFFKRGYDDDSSYGFVNAYGAVAMAAGIKEKMHDNTRTIVSTSEAEGFGARYMFDKDNNTGWKPEINTCAQSVLIDLGGLYWYDFLAVNIKNYNSNEAIEDNILLETSRDRIKWSREAYTLPKKWPSYWANTARWVRYIRVTMSPEAINAGATVTDIWANTLKPLMNYEIVNGTKKDNSVNELKLNQLYYSSRTLTNPTNPMNLKVTQPAKNTLGVIWGQNSEAVENGFKYNVYVDGVKKLSNVPCAYFEIKDIEEGEHIVKVTSVYCGYESTGSERGITVVEEVEAPGLLEVIGILVTNPSRGTVGIVWGQDADRINSGCKYNVYVDGEKKLSLVPCAYYQINNLSEGEHQIRVSAVLDGVETYGAYRYIDVIS